MEIDRQFIKDLSLRTNFQPQIIEKAYRIGLLLKEVSAHPVLAKELVLKGGTAINFLYLALPRLSIDLDFNFIGATLKEEKDFKRAQIKKYLDTVFAFLKYQVKERDEYGLHQFFLNYKNSASNNDIIKLEINYLLRISLLLNENKELRLPALFKDLNFITKALSLEEIYAGKINALITRGAPRDLFDVYSLLKEGLKFNKLLLKKIVIFLGCLNRKDFRRLSCGFINNITEKEIKSDLFPLLRKGMVVSKGRMIRTVKPLLEDILTLNKQEKEYVDRFFKGEYIPELLFTKHEVVDLEALKRHPLALWKQQHIKEWLEGRKENKNSKRSKDNLANASK